VLERNPAHLHEHLLVVGPSKCGLPSSNPSSKIVHDLAKGAFAIAGIRSSEAIVLLRSQGIRKQLFVFSFDYGAA
jgi:hypothetical protein